MRKVIFFLICMIGYFLIAPKINAQAVINEINPSDEWVELFKISQGALGLDGCVVFFQDTKSQKKNLTVDDSFLENELFKVIYTGGNYLNNTESDTVLLDCPNFDDGPITYGNNMGTKSFARVPNGTGSFVVLSESTPGSANPDPTPEPTPTPTASPTPSPSPTPTPTPTKTPVPTPTKTPTSTPTKIPTPTKTPSPKPTNTPVDNVLGEETILPSPTAGILVQPEDGNQKNKFPFLAIALIIAGVGLTGFSVFSIIKSSKKSYTIESENKNNQIS